MQQKYTEWQILDGSGFFVCGGIHFNDLIARSEASKMYSEVFKPGYQLYYTEKTTVSTPGKIRR
jgi:hypothetical protein